MKIKVEGCTIVHGAKGQSAGPGEIVDVKDTEEAQRLIARGFATAVETPPPAKPTSSRSQATSEASNKTAEGVAAASPVASSEATAPSGSTGPLI